MFTLVNFGSLMTDVFFSTDSDCNIKVKKSMDFLVWVGKTRGTLWWGDVIYRWPLWTQDIHTIASNPSICSANQVCIARGGGGECLPATNIKKLSRFQVFWLILREYYLLASSHVCSIKDALFPPISAAAALLDLKSPAWCCLFCCHSALRLILTEFRILSTKPT